MKKAAAVKVELVQGAVLVRKADGSADVEATLQNCRLALETQEKARLESNAKFGAIMGAIYDEHKGVGIDMQTLANEIANRCQATLEERPSVTNNALNYIRSVTGEKGKAEFGSLKGKGKVTGTFRWADCPEVASAK